MSTQQIIVNSYPLLTPELRRAAEFTLQHANELVVLSMRAFARQAGVQPATLLRMAKKLGFAGWSELKNAFIDDLGLSNEPYGRKAQRLIGQGENNALYKEIFTSHHANLTHTQSVNTELMKKAVSILDKAGNVYICGFRASFPIAYSLYYIYRLFKKNVFLIDGHASNIEMFTRDLTPQDAVLVTGFAPYSKETILVFNAAKQAGSSTVSITDSLISPLALEADATLHFHTDSPSFFPSVLSGIGISECLLAMLVAKHGQQAVKEIENAEKHLIATGAYIMPGQQ
ncbi:MurR/RpiR family transcriptional regulator [Brenneria tiliae]|uniref:MurR/RpiR family transcriptional regulator n=1 Tax=Brenneria tiliae TaxID=2914984 RepID=A0ABT0MX27_9GAMM|nr:MurR/RpiR family transcriptional regulator [Brenneria tiliae]MCL2894406.1 MurR/RpiR family transcriptional regulator [Brenneria tiliae]